MASDTQMLKEALFCGSVKIGYVYGIQVKVSELQPAGQVWTFTPLFSTLKGRMAFSFSNGQKSHKKNTVL